MQFKKQRASRQNTLFLQTIAENGCLRAIPEDTAFIENRNEENGNGNGNATLSATGDSGRTGEMNMNQNHNEDEVNGNDHDPTRF